MKILAAILAVFGLIWPLSARAEALSEWPVFHGDAARAGFSSSRIPSSAKVLWEITTNQLKDYGVNEFEIQRPIIGNGKVFFATGRIFAVDLSTGNFVWNYKGDRPDFYPNFLASGGGKVFATAVNSNRLKNMSEGFVYALDENTGELLWKYQTQKQITHSSPLFAEGKVFVGDDSGTVYAVEANTGKLAWQRQLAAYVIHSSPAYAQGVIYVGTETRDIGSYLYALNAEDGKVLWQFQSDWRGNDMPNLIHGTPAISNGAVYFGSENGWFYALNKDDGAVIWKKIITNTTRTSARQAADQGLVGVSTAPSLGYGKVFVGTWEGKFLALSQKDGQVVWEYTYGTEGTDSSAVVSDNKVCLGSHYEYFYCFNESDGKVLWKEKLGGPSAAAADGVLVVPNALAGESPGRIIVAFSDKSATGSPVTTATVFSFANQNLQIVAVSILGLVILTAVYLRFRRHD